MRLTVVSGGTAANALVGLFSNISDEVTFVLPISDNGGSTSEIIRVIGGPAIGDIRSRIMNLVPKDRQELRKLFSYRLNNENEEEAKEEWNKIIDGTHVLWEGIESHIREMIRPFFIHVHVELLKRSRPRHEFKFERASVGNLYLTGARLFCGSLESAIELLSRISGVLPKFTVLPCINSNFSHHISAELYNGKVITGQSQISHPSETIVDQLQEFDGGELFEDAGHLPFTHPALASSQLRFSKETTPLASPIKRVFYINPYGQEIRPVASARVTKALGQSEAVIYSIGSLYTSIIPVLLVGGFGNQVIKARRKILILNGKPDRETEGMDVLGYIQSVVDACRYSMGANNDKDELEWALFITDLVYLDSDPPCGIHVPVGDLTKRGIKCHGVKSSEDVHIYDMKALEDSLTAVLQ